MSGLKADLGRSQRDARLRTARGLDEQEATRLSSLEEALAMARFLRRLPRRAPDGRFPREHPQLELEAHEGHKHASISLLRALMAARADEPLGDAFTRAGRARTRERARALRERRMEELSAALRKGRRGEGYLSPRYIPWETASEGEEAPSVGPLASRKELASLERALKVLLEGGTGRSTGDAEG